MFALMKIIQQTLRSTGHQFVPYPFTDWTRGRNLMAPLLERLGINVVLDVGANVGQFGQKLRMYGYKGWIVSFEPVRENYEALAGIAAADRRWRTEQYALGAETGSFDINVMRGTECSSFLAPLMSGRTNQNIVERRETVEVKRLDSVLNDCLQGIANPVIFLKLDTQGFDMEAVKGATGVLNLIQLIQSEVSFKPIYSGMPTYSESIESLGQLGFGVYDFTPVSREAPGNCVIEMDCVFVRRPRAGDAPPV